MELTAGTELPSLVVDGISVDDIRTVMDVMGDVNPVHIDEELVRRLGLRGLVNQGPANLGYVVNMLLRTFPEPAVLRRLAFRFHASSSPGDELTARARILEASSVNGGSALRCEITLDRQDGARVLSGTADVLVGAGER